jgi:hypothetical protein
MTSHEVPTPVSRREFARRVAVATAAAATALAVPAAVRAQSMDTAPTAATSQPALSKEVAEEVEAKFNEILRLDGPRFSPQHKEEIRRQLISQVRGLQKLRAYALDNADAPATVLHLSAREGN